MPEGQMAVMKDGSRRDPHVCATTTTPQPPQTHLPRGPMSTSRALKPIGPAYFHQVVAASPLRGEPALKLLDGPGENGVTLGRPFLSHPPAIFSNLGASSA
jgi:hypothetical protein